MGWVTRIQASAQVDYRLSRSAGCGLEHEHDVPAEASADGPEANAAVEYRLDSALPLRWIGSGLDAVGIAAGAVFADGDEAKARALMAGVDPRNGEVLVKPKLVTDPRGCLASGPLLEAIDARAAAAGQDVAALLEGHKWAAARHGRAERGLVREGDGHRIPYTDARRLAGAAGVDLTEVYDPDRLAEAGRYSNAKLRVGLMGHDVVFDLTKGISAVWALAPEELAQELLELHLAAVTEAVGSLEGWASYTMRGEHGKDEQGERHVAERLPSGGFLGWTMGHQVARPVGDAAPDPHVHIHVMLAHMVRTVDDEKWRTPGAGGRDLMRHAHAVDALAKARFRQMLTETYGVSWTRDERTGAWEIAGVPAELVEAMSKRHNQIEKEKARLGLTEATLGQDKTISASTREAKTGGGAGGELRTTWRDQAEAVTVDDVPLDVDAMVAAAVPGWPHTGLSVRHDPPPPMPLAELAARVFDPETGITAHTKAFRRAGLLARIADELPGVDAAATVEAYADQLLADERYAVQLPELGSAHMSNHQRYTTPDILEAENTIIDAAHDRLDARAAVVPALAAAGAIDVFEATAGYPLSQEQRAAVLRFLTSGHGVDALVGVAGAGKTTLLAAAYTGWSAAGMVVAGCSTAATAAANLQAGSGIPATTLASWLARIRSGEGLSGVDVLVVDEGAMTDDRQVAELMREANTTGTKFVLVGDPMQLRSPGVGGSFGAVHRVVEGVALIENRRQADEAERAALALWRDGDRKAALAAWSQAGRVHAATGAAEAHAAILARWDTQRRTWPDPHAQIEHLLVLAATNADVATLNAGARAIRIAGGEIDTGRTYAVAGGAELTVSVGDHVLTRVNDYRSAKTRGRQDDVLNGYRGVVTAVGERGIHVRLADGADPVFLSTNYLSRGGVQLGYAMTIAKSQGLTATQALVYGAGADDHTLYPAMSRDRQRVDLFLPRQLLEDPDTRTRLGEPATDAEALDRAIAAMVKHLEQSADDIMVTVELGRRLPEPRHPEPEPAAPTRFVPAWPMAWERPDGLRTDDQVDQGIQTARTRAAEALARAAEADRQADIAAGGNGPATAALNERAQQLADAADAIAAARQALAARQAADADVDRMRDAMRQARTRIADSTGLLDRGRRRQAERDLAHLQETFPTALDRAADAADAVRDRYDQAPAPVLWNDLLAEHRDFAADIEGHTARAAAQDAQRAAGQRAAAEVARTEAAEADLAGQALAREAELRAGMPAAARAIEDCLRGLRTTPPQARDAVREALAHTEQLGEGYTPWTARRYGYGSAASMEAWTGKATREAATANAQAERHEAAAARTRQRAAAGAGQSMTDLAARGAELAAAARLDEAGDPLWERFNAANARHAQVVADLQDVQGRLQEHTGMGLRLRGTSRAALAEQSDQLRQAAADARADAIGASAELVALHGGTRPAPSGQGRRALAEHQRNLPTLRLQAMAEDQALAQVHAEASELKASGFRRQAQRAEGGVAGLAAERELRAQMPPEIGAMEDATRDQARQERRAAEDAAPRRAASRTPSHAQQQYLAHEWVRRPGPERGGPGFGR